MVSIQQVSAEIFSLVVDVVRQQRSARKDIRGSLTNLVASLSVGLNLSVFCLSLPTSS